jgi:hypothetical protein
MFDLEKSIADWRKQMLAAGIKTPVPLEELEIHLRENIEQQIESGINERLAFEVAIQQIGKANMLKDEFAKVEAAKQARREKFGAIMLVATTNLILWGMVGMALFKIAGSLLVLLGQSISRIFPVIRDRRIRGLINYSAAVTVLLWFSVFLNLIAPSLGFTTSQLKLMIPWVCFIPSGAYIGLIFGLDIAARKPIATSDQYA